MSLASRVLIVDDDPSLNRTLGWLLQEHGYETTSLESGEQLLEYLDTNPVDLLILDLGLPLVDGLTLLEMVKGRPSHRDLPVLLLSGGVPEAARVKALGLGAADFMTKPFRAPELLARIRARLRAGGELNRARSEARFRAELADIMKEISASQTPAELFHALVRRVAKALRISKCSILLTDKDPETAAVVAAAENPALRHLVVELKRYPEVREPLETGQAVVVRDVLVDSLFAETRELWRTEGRMVPTTSVATIPFVLKGKRSGVLYLRTIGNDPPLDQRDVVFATQVMEAAAPLVEKASELEETLRRQDQMRQLAETDPLTGLYNRRAFRERLEREMDRATRHNAVISCLMLDLDHFKTLNDTYGHDLGDTVLVQLADLLRREQRAMDVVARLGGEEFVVLLPETGIRGARIFAERILRRTAVTTFGDANHKVQVTVSIGISTHPDEGVTDGDTLLLLADANLLRAKADGRNRYRD